ncbi:MAG: SDR family NAD(P)-dependent oxidoreductase [Gammaproteobacteria bacterium]|jgi:short-subunit dehydrogenase
MKMVQEHMIALITGATSGIGAAFARALAKQNYNLIITGRREDKIKVLAQELMRENSINVEVIIAELANDKDLAELIKTIKKLDNLAILINNAGFTKGNKFYEEDIITYENMMKVHALATMKLTYAALPSMIANKMGTIINVSSIMSFFPYFRQSIYTATKAFVSLFTESISLDLKNTGVQVQVLCPGLTLSDLHERIGLDVRKLAKKRAWLWKPPMKAEEVVEKSLKYLQKNKVICIPGFFNKLIVFMRTLRRLF